MLYLHAIRVVSLLIYLSKTVADLMGIIYVAGMDIVVGFGTNTAVVVVHAQETAAGFGTVVAEGHMVVGDPLESGLA